MIRLAFLAVLALGGLIAFGAFFLVRGTGGDDALQAEIAAAPAIAADAPAEEPNETPLFFLADVDTTTGQMTVVLRDALTGTGDLVVRDQAAITASKDIAYINTTPSGGELAGMVVMAMMGVQPQTAVVQIYRDDTLIAAVDCTSTTCGDVASDIDMDLGPLLDAAQPLIAATSYTETYDDYLADLDAVKQSPDYMFLDLQNEAATPQPRQTAKLELHLPTLVTPAGTSVDPDITSALVRGILDPMLPDGATITGVTFLGIGKGIVADMDSSTPVLAGGAQIEFPDVEFTNLRVTVGGTATLDETALAELTAKSPTPLDYTSAFASFVRETLQSSCDDCFRVMANGEHYTETTITLSEPEGYRLDYYDLRDPP